MRREGPRARDASRIAVATSLDDAYVLPASTMLASLVANLGEGRSLELFLLDAGVSQGGKRRLEAVLGGRDVRATWISVDRAAFARLHQTAHC